MADAVDSKSTGVTPVRVRLPSQVRNCKTLRCTGARHGAEISARIPDQIDDVEQAGKRISVMY